MKKMILFLLAACAALCATAVDPDSYPVRDSVPFTARGGLPNFAAKANAGEPVTVVYFGGSITEQNGWRLQSADLLKRLLPKAQIKTVNAAIGGTGSDLGAFRLNYDVLRHKPDLVFVEFAVNDHGARAERIRNAIEGIVRQIRKAYPECDICFVYTITTANLKSYQAGKLPPSAAVMEEIAEYYRIPTVNISYEVAQLEKEGKLIMAGTPGGMTRVSGDELNTNSDLPKNAEGKIVFSGDGVHPYPDTGHRIYTAMLARALPVLLKTGTAGAAKLPAPMLATNWENTTSVSLDAPGIKLSGPAKQLPGTNSIARSFAGRMPKIWKLEPGSTIEFKFRGTKAMLYDLYGPDTPYYEVEIDGKAREMRRFDGYCTYHRLALCGLADKLPDAVHTVKITVLPKKIDRREILFERNRANFDKNPDKYALLNGYAGQLFLVGELVK